MELRQRRRVIPIETEYADNNPQKNKAPVVVQVAIYAFLKIPFFICFILLIGYLLSPIDPDNLSWVVRVDNMSNPRLRVNKRLTEGQSIQMPGPECIVEDEEKNIYTGLESGKVIRISPGPNYKIGAGRHDLFLHSRFGGAAKTDPSAEHGRPLGLRISNGKLFVMDAVYGLYSVHLKTRQIEFIIKPNDVNPPLVLPDDLVISKDGATIYFTDATTRFPISKSLYTVLEGQCTGRLFEYDVSSREILLLKSELCFANGVQLSPSENTLVVAEMTARRVLFYDTKTWKVMHRTHFPTIPDNVRLNSRGNYWVGTTGPHSFASDLVFTNPWLNRIITGLVPYRLLKLGIDGRHSILYEIDQTGRVIQTLHDAQGKLINGLSHACDLSDGQMALGSYTGDRMAIAKYEPPPIWMEQL